MTATAALAFAVIAATHEPSPARLRAAVAHALPPLRVAAETHADKRTCFACHNQAYPLLAFDAARKLGFEPDPVFLREQIRHLRAFATAHRKDWDELKGTGGQVDTAGWLLASYAAAGVKPDADTAAIVKYLLNRHAERPHWTVSSNRPPTQASSFTSSYLAVHALQQWGTEDQKPEIAKRIATVRAWALKTRPKDTEDRVSRLRLLAIAGAAAADVAAAANELRDEQRPDGGWAQLPKLASDSYATATVLAALADAGGLATTTPAYVRGIEFLLRTQRADGTWQVTARAAPIQPYFEAGYPYGRDQFLSSSAAAWAVIALAKAAEK